MLPQPLLFAPENVLLHPAFLWSVGGLLLSGLLFLLLSFFVASVLVYDKTLRRKDANQWSRERPSADDELTVKMDEIGQIWRQNHLEFKKDAHIVNRDGMNLYGEYYDLGNDKCVLILAGRTDTLRYGFYFAKPYEECGYNLLVIDPRAHGNSDGEFNTLGFEESKDAIEWIRYLQKNHGVSSVLIHGNCIGAAGAVYLATSTDCPDCVEAVVAEGMYVNFGESMKNHLIERKKPIFPLYQLINLRMKHFTGFTMDPGPIDVIGELKLPLLMLHSKMDSYSVPKNAELLFARAGSAVKKIVWFDVGRHSMIRINNTEAYDLAICSFIQTELASVKAPLKTV